MNVSYDFSGRTVVVTGAAQGIGAAIADAFVSAGASVVAADVNAESLRTRWEGVDHVRQVAADISDSASAAEIVHAAQTWRGAVDVVVNNAGITRDAVVWKMDDDQWDAVVAVHLTGTFNLTRAAIPVMRSAAKGRIVNVTSYSGLHGNVGQANYAAAKAGIVGFSKTVAKEVARFGITVNVVSPNAETPMVAAVPPEKKEELMRSIPLGRFGDVSEMSAAIAFLASDEAGYITGAVLPVDGGMSM